MFETKFSMYVCWSIYSVGNICFITRFQSWSHEILVSSRPTALKFTGVSGGRSVATNTSQISERHDCFSTQSRDFDTSQDLVISRLRTAWWLEDHLCSCDLVKFTKWYSDDAFVRELLICWKILVMVTTPMNSAVKCELTLNSTVIVILKQLLSYSRKGD